MKNIKEFIDYKTNCPYCDGVLSLQARKYYSEFTDTIIENNTLIIKSKFKTWAMDKKSANYKVNLNINIEDGIFDFDIYNNFSIKLDERSTMSMKTDVDNIFNSGGFFLQKFCDKCMNYSYVSSVLTLSKNKCATIYYTDKDLKIMNEYSRIKGVNNYFIIKNNASQYDAKFMFCKEDNSNTKLYNAYDFCKLDLITKNNNFIYSDSSNMKTKFQFIEDDVFNFENWSQKDLYKKLSSMFLFS